jgi:hypothetical protein
MPTTTELRTLLEEAGEREVPLPRPEFVAGLEAHLLVPTTDLQTLLEEAGERDVPLPRPEFVASLEARLLSDAATITKPTPLVAHAGSRSRVRYLRPAMLSAAAAVAAVVLVGSLAGLFGQDPTQRDLELTSANNTTVVLPDGHEVDAAPGQDLPDGTEVHTGDTGSATVGNVEIGPNQVATVQNGTIQIAGVEVTVPTLPVTVPTVPTVPEVLPPLGG